MKIPIANESGEIIGEEERSIVHEKGLLHSEVFVIIKLKNNKIVFQRRSLTKETKPGLITLSVSGHIDIGMTKEMAVIKELKEETGIDEKIEKLEYLGIIKLCTNDSVTNTINNAIRYFYGYHFDGDINDLKVEKNDGAGFVELSLDQLNNLNEVERGKFVETTFNPDVINFMSKV